MPMMWWEKNASVLEMSVLRLGENELHAHCFISQDWMWMKFPEGSLSVGGDLVESEMKVNNVLI